MLARARHYVQPEQPPSVQSLIPVARPFMPKADQVAPYLERMDAERWYSNFGPLTSEFEAGLSARFGGTCAVVTTVNGTLGLVLALSAVRRSTGALCILPAWTFVASAHAVLQAGLEPWFADVDQESMALRPDRAREMLAAAPGQVGAIVAVAPFGAPIDYDGWLSLQADTGVPVVIDAAAAFDAATDARLPTMVSLHATKTLGAGEGGFIATVDPALAERVRELSSFGFNGSREARIAATNAKMSEYTAAVGLAALGMWPSTRIRYLLAAQRLKIALLRTPDVVFQNGWGSDWVSSVCVVKVPEGAADQIEARLRTVGVDTRRWWSKGCQASPAFSHFRCADLSGTHRLADSTLGIPYAADMTIESIDRVADALARVVAEG
jgi:dTDP-4-amino-4,6-dideoxygalactose transaminase